LSLRNSFVENKSDEEVIAKYTSKPLLILDDFGSEKITEFSRQSMYAIIDRIYRNCTQLIVTSNLSLGKISELLDDRISSRLAEMCEVVKLDGKDWRVNK